MKCIRIVILAIAAITGVGANAAAEELTFNPPDINGKLNALVEEKMDALIDKAEVNREHADAQKDVTNAGEQHPEAAQHAFIYVVTDSRE